MKNQIWLSCSAGAFFFQAEFDLVDTLVFLNNIKTWGVGGSYVVAKNTLFNVYQSFGSKWKTNKTNADDPAAFF